LEDPITGLVQRKVGAPLWELLVAPLWKQVGVPLEELLTASLWEHSGAPSWNMKEALDIEQGYSDKGLKAGLLGLGALLLEMIALLLEVKLCPIWIEDL
jgi:hypothetical protein